MTFTNSKLLFILRFGFINIYFYIVFLNIVNCFNTDNSPKSKLRKWLGELYYDTNYADSLLKRINQVIDKKSRTATNNALKELNNELSLDNLFINWEDTVCQS